MPPIGRIIRGLQAKGLLFRIEHIHRADPIVKLPGKDLDHLGKRSLSFKRNAGYACDVQEQLCLVQFAAKLEA